MPRWAFEKLPGTRGVLGTQMQSVGEVMAIGRTFPESLQKALRSLETGRLGLNADAAEVAYDGLDDDELLARAAVPTPERPFAVEAALRRGMPVELVHEASKIDPWFLDQLLRIVEEREHLGTLGLDGMSRRDWRRAKRLGFADGQLAWLWGTSEAEVRAARLAAGVRATFKTVDTCAAEFEASTPYHYATYEDTDEVEPSSRPKVVILGSGPNRIGQGVEFDYCCVHASFALRDAGFETVMVNCNPETVSTDYDTSDRLYFEPLTREDVLNVLEAEQAAAARRTAAQGRGFARRPNAAEAERSAAARADRRHQPGEHRPGRGPRPLELPVCPARDPPAPRRHGLFGRRGAGRDRPGGLPGAGPARATCSAGGPCASSTTSPS